MSLQRAQTLTLPAFCYRSQRHCREPRTALHRTTRARIRDDRTGQFLPNHRGRRYLIFGLCQAQPSRILNHMNIFLTKSRPISRNRMFNGYLVWGFSA
jgi:hypothetical protein